MRATAVAAALLVLALGSATSDAGDQPGARSSARLLETLTVPAGQGSSFPAVASRTVLQRGEVYRLGVSGSVAWTAGSLVDRNDALYCYETLNSPFGQGCSGSRLGPRGFLELKQGSFTGALDLIDDPRDTSTRGRLPYDPEHEYVVTFKARSDGKLQASHAYTNVPERSGAYKVKLYDRASLDEPVKKRPCKKTYLIMPSGEKIVASVFRTELTRKRRSNILEREKGKYGEADSYDPITRRPTNKENCAGLVMRSLFSEVQRGNVDPDDLFEKVLKPYGKHISSLRARAGDVVVYRSGAVKHVAVVESGGFRLKIISKDQAERTYRATLPRVFPDNDPLVQAHGDYEIWRLDKSKVTIQEVSEGECDS